MIRKSLDKKPAMTTLNDSVTDLKGHVILENGDKVYDTKRYIRVNDI